MHEGRKRIRVSRGPEGVADEPGMTSSHTAEGTLTILHATLHNPTLGCVPRPHSADKSKNEIPGDSREQRPVCPKARPPPKKKEGRGKKSEIRLKLSQRSNTGLLSPQRPCCQQRHRARKDTSVQPHGFSGTSHDSGPKPTTNHRPFALVPRPMVKGWFWARTTTPAPGNPPHLSPRGLRRPHRTAPGLTGAPESRQERAGKFTARRNGSGLCWNCVWCVTAEGEDGVEHSSICHSCLN